MYPWPKTKTSVHVRSHIRNRPHFVRFAFPLISAPMNFPSRGRRRSNLQWIFPRGPGIVSCTTHTIYVLLPSKKNLGPYKESCQEPTPFSSLRIFINFYPHEFPFTWPSKIELALEISSAARCCVMYYTYYLSTAPLQTHFASHSPPERS